MFDYIFLDTAPERHGAHHRRLQGRGVLPPVRHPRPLRHRGPQRRPERHRGRPGCTAIPSLTLLGVILSMMDRRTNLAKTLRDYVQEKFALDGHESLKFATTIDRSTEVPKAQREGKTLFSNRPGPQGDRPIPPAGARSRAAPPHVRRGAEEVPMAKRAKTDGALFNPVADTLVRAVTSPQPRIMTGYPDESAGVEPLSREKRVLLTPSEERDLNTFLLELGAALGTQVQLSHLLRACD